MRTKKSARNLAFALGGQFLSVAAGLVLRTFFIKCLAEDYLGISGLFTNILSMLSLVELGVGSAMTYSLYKPLATHDQEKVKSLMQLYKRAYTAVGALVIFMGLCLLPFYRQLIENPPQIPELDIIFLLYVVNTGGSYFFSYKKALIVSDQNRYIETIVYTLFDLLLNAAQIVILVTTHNYLLYFGIQVLFTFARNFAVAKKADRMYPYLRDKNIRRLTAEDMAPIKRNVGAMMLHKIGAVVVKSTDNVIISKFVGLSSVGLYSNYFLITNGLNKFAGQVFSSVVASVGNAAAMAGPKKLNDIFEKIFFIDFWIYGFCAICLYNLFNPFILLWVGRKFLFPMGVVVTIVVNFYLNGMSKTAVTFRDATGNYYADRFKPVLEAIVNLVVSLWLVKKLGVAGVFLGTIISTLTTGFWIEPVVIYRRSLEKSVWTYFGRYFLYTACTLFACAVTTALCSLVGGSGLLSFIGKMAVCAVTPNLIFLLAFCRTREFRFYVDLIIHKLREYKKRRSAEK